MKEWKTSRLYWPISLQGLISAVGMVGLTILCTAPVASAEDLVNATWYQVDVVIFKPKNADLDEESWPVTDVSYPAGVYSIDEPEFFKLAQLEQLESLPFESGEATGQSQPQQSEFAFEGRANRARNQRIIESATARRADADLTNQRTAADPGSPGGSALDNSLGQLENGSDEDDKIKARAASIADQVRAAMEGATESIWDEAFIRTESSSSLTAIARSVNRSSRFTLLSHYSWVQPIGSEDQSVLIQTGKRYNDQYEIEGSLAFSRSRFLHVDTNLWFTRFEPRGATANPYKTSITSTLDQKTLAQHDELARVERERGQYYPVQQHLMSQSRRMRSDELHYLDHPLIGIVIRINRYERDNAASAE